MEMAPRRCADAGGQRGELRERVEREVDLCRRPAEPVALHLVDELGRQLARVEQREERPAGIDARQHEVGVDFVAVGEHDADGALIFRRGSARPAPRSALRRRPDGPLPRSHSRWRRFLQSADPHDRNTPSSSPM